MLHCYSPLPRCQRRLYSGLYMNELLMRLLQPEDPHRKLFDHYAAILSLLAEGDDEEIPLRRFELVLLEELGYGFDLASDGLSGNACRAILALIWSASPGEIFPDRPVSVPSDSCARPWRRILATGR